MARSQLASLCCGIAEIFVLAGVPPASAQSPDFPTTAGAYDRTFDGWDDAFVARLNSQGWLLSSTYLGGSSSDDAFGVAVDGSGNAVVCGEIHSPDFPTTAGAYVDRTYNGDGCDTFVACLSLQPLASIGGRLVLGQFSGDASTQVARIEVRVGGTTIETTDGVALASDGSFEVAKSVRGTADLDGDGAVTVFDYNILSANFDRVGE